MALLAKTLPENILIYSSYICQESRQYYVEVKIVFQAHKLLLRDIFLHFSHILFYNFEMVILLTFKVYLIQVLCVIFVE